MQLIQQWLLLVVGVFIFSALMLLFALSSSTSLSSSVGEKVYSNGISGVSGDIFSGDVFRKLDSSELKFTNFVHSQLRTAAAGDCAQWAVVTTINPPTDSVLRISALKDWCLVVIGDKKTPSFVLPVSPNLHYLGVKEQEKFGSQFPELFASIPWNHFGRKNLGYLFAISHGAQKVWDFDDDNPLVQGGSIPTFPAENDLKQVDAETSCNVFNPYPRMGGPGGIGQPSWPRGLPLNLIRNACVTSESVSTVPVSRIGVVQSLANSDPDVDAIYRLTRGTPFNFTKSNDWMLLGQGVLTPYNAQATLVLAPALWSLLLPVTVHGRVSDIWRSYIAQRLFFDIGVHVVFAPPHVDQFRNVHNYLGDLKAEDDLYIKSTALVAFLRDWHGKANSLAGRFEELTVNLYERGYLEKADVHLTQLWIGALIRTKYEFPPLTTAAQSRRQMTSQAVGLNNVAICIRGVARGVRNSQNFRNTFAAFKADYFISGAIYDNAYLNIISPISAVPPVDGPTLRNILTKQGFNESVWTIPHLNALGGIIGPGSAVYQYYDLSRCHNMILKEEKSRGHQYDSVIVVRSDHWCLAPPFAPSDLQNQAIYIPAGEDWSQGLNDRMIALPREISFNILGRPWQSLVTNTHIDYFRSNAENVLKNVVIESQAPLVRFEPTCFLACISAVHALHGCYAIPQKPIEYEGYKYYEEYSWAVVASAKRLNSTK